MVGNNGAGKSTLIRLLTGQLYGYAGSYKLDGHEADTLKGELLARHGFSYVPDIPILDPPLTGMEVCEMAGSFRGLAAERVESGLSDHAELFDLGEWFGGVTCDKYSKGMRKKTSLVIGIPGRPGLRHSWTNPSTAWIPCAIYNLKRHLKDGRRGGLGAHGLVAYAGRGAKDRGRAHHHEGRDAGVRGRLPGPVGRTSPGRGARRNLLRVFPEMRKAKPPGARSLAAAAFTCLLGTAVTGADMYFGNGNGKTGAALLGVLLLGGLIFDFLSSIHPLRYPRALDADFIAGADYAHRKAAALRRLRAALLRQSWMPLAALCVMGAQLGLCASRNWPESPRSWAPKRPSSPLP